MSPLQLIEKSAIFRYGGAHHLILLTGKDPIRFAKVYPDCLSSYISLLNTGCQSAFATEVLYPSPIALVKISTLLLYGRIFPGQTFKRMLWALGLFISTYSAIWTVTTIFQCRPISRVWDPTTNAECIDSTIVWAIMGSLNVLTDILVLCLPLPKLWRLQMRRRIKLQVIAIFSIGSLSVNPIRKV